MPTRDNSSAFETSGIHKSLPSLSGELTRNHEKLEAGGGSNPKEFAPPEIVTRVFQSGIGSLRLRLQQSQQKEDSKKAVIARVKLRSKGIAKSHRHEALFSHLQVVGVDMPGEMLAVVTPHSLNDLAGFVRRASARQLQQLSSVEVIEPYQPAVEVGHTKSVITLFGGHLDDGTQLQQLGIDTLRDQGVELKPYGKLKFHYITESKPSEQSLKAMPWIRKVRPALRLRSIARIGTNPVRALNVNPVSAVLPEPIVGIIDSGIDRSIPWLSRLVVKQHSHIPKTYSDLNHGTLVGALAASGGGFNNNPTTFPAPVARLLDIQVLGVQPYDQIDEADLLIQLENAIKSYGPASKNLPPGVDEHVIIWNLSLGADSACDEADFSNLAQELDRISFENKVIFTIAAGNYSSFPLRGWDHAHGPDNIPNNEDRIASPADSALAIVVGSLSDTSNPPSAAPADCPSPFSRRGPGPGMLIKPDVVHYGGTCDRSGRHAGSGIQGPAAGGGWQKNIGTSFATPRVAAELAKLVSWLPNPEPELLKLLVLLSCETRGAHTLEKRESVNYYGFGVVTDVVSMLGCEPWECILLLRGELRPGYSFNVDFPFPKSLVDQGLRRGYVRMALVYTPVLDVSKGAEYCQTNVSASLGRVSRNPKGGPSIYRREIPPVPSEQSPSHQYEKDLIQHGWKWSPAKVYERRFQRMQADPKEIGWRLSVELLLRRELEPLRITIRQPFWLGIRMADPDKRANVYQEMRQQLSLIGLAQPIQLKTRVQVRPTAQP
jgi:subtilisin family serine protease